MVSFFLQLNVVQNFGRLEGLTYLCELDFWIPHSLRHFDRSCDQFQTTTKKIIKSCVHL